MKGWPIVLAAVACFAAEPLLCGCEVKGSDPASLIATVANGQGADLFVPSRLIPELRSEESLHRARLSLALLKGVGKPVRFGPLMRQERGDITVFVQLVQFERESREIQLAITPDGLIAGFHVKGTIPFTLAREPAVAPHSTRVLVVRSNSETAEWVRQAARGKAAPVPEQVTIMRGVKYIFPIIVVGYTPTRSTFEALRVRYEVLDPEGMPVDVPVREAMLDLIDPATPGLVVNQEQLTLAFAQSVQAGKYVVTGIVEDTLRHVTSEARVTVVVPGAIR